MPSEIARVAVPASGMSVLPFGNTTLRDRGRGMVDAAVGERRVGVGLLERRDPDPKAADPLRRDAVERRGDPELLGHLLDVVRADVQVELREDDVHGVDGRLADVHRPALAVPGVVDGPGRPVVKGERHRALAGVVGGVGVHSLLQRGGEHVGLERGPGLAVGVGREVELGAGRVRRGRGHRQDVAVRGVDRGERRLRTAARVADRTGVDGVLGVGLERRVDRRVDLEPAAPDGVDAVLVDQLLLDVVEEVRLLDLLVLVALVEAKAAL